MKIERFEKIGKDKYRLYLDNGEVIDTYDEVILKNDLLFKKEISPSFYQRILLESKLGEQYHAALKYISVRIRSTKEIKDYLKRKNVAEEDIEQIVQKLTLNHALDDDYFCECFIKDKLRFTTMGEYRIVNELKKHEIDNQIIEKYMELMNESVMREKIKKIIEKQMKSNRKLDCQKLRNKLYHQLLGLGYSSSLIVEVLNQSF
ncbi:MAG: RecX family transcriptional regulator [Erysipelotrichaceae bacterium]|nr:RecX family transcriptional regulator [Erysipelotrichaceae bacterium]